MTDLYLLVKWLHIVSATILIGFGAGTAWYFWSAHLTRDAATIASVGRMVVRADWIFTGTSGVAQPASGLVLIGLLGYSPWEPWLLLAYLLYAIAFACWAPVVWLQIRAQRLAQAALESAAPLSAEYFRTMRLWLLLGWPALFALLGILWLMIARPEPW